LIDGIAVLLVSRSILLDATDHFGAALWICPDVPFVAVAPEAGAVVLATGPMSAASNSVAIAAVRA